MENNIPSLMLALIQDFEQDIHLTGWQASK
jgi:hypothetical protein